MDYAVLDLCLGEHCFNRCGKSGQIIRTGNENILYTSISQPIEDGCPEFAAFIFTDPHTKNIFFAVQIDSYGDVDSLFDDLTLTPDMIVDGIQKYNRIDAPGVFLYCPHNLGLYTSQAGRFLHNIA